MNAEWHQRTEVWKRSCHVVAETGQCDVDEFTQSFPNFGQVRVREPNVRVRDIHFMSTPHSSRITALSMYRYPTARQMGFVQTSAALSPTTRYCSVVPSMS